MNSKSVTTSFCRIRKVFFEEECSFVVSPKMVPSLTDQKSSPFHPVSDFPSKRVFHSPPCKEERRVRARRGKIRSCVLSMVIRMNFF